MYIVNAQQYSFPLFIPIYWIVDGWLLFPASHSQGVRKNIFFAFPQVEEASLVPV